MNKRITSSREQFEQAKLELSSQQENKPRKKRGDRSSWELIKSFLGLLRGQRRTMAFALATLTVATLLALVPPAATKIVVDYVLGDQPLPEFVPAWVPREQWPLLLAITGVVLAISFVKLGVHIWGRWHATRVTKLLQMSVRRRVFAHVMRLPLHRIQELKSGGGGEHFAARRGERRRPGFWAALQSLASGHSTGGQLVRIGDCRLAIAAGGIVRVAPGVRHAPHMDRANSSAASAHSRPARESGWPGDRGFWRHASCSCIRQATSGNEPHHAGQPSDGSTGIARLVVDALDRNRMGSADAGCQCGAAGLRRLASDSRGAELGRPGYVLGLPIDASGTAGSSRPERGDVAEWIIWPRSNCRLARRTDRNGDRQVPAEQ